MSKDWEEPQLVLNIEKVMRERRKQDKSLKLRDKTGNALCGRKSLHKELQAISEILYMQTGGKGARS